MKSGHDDNYPPCISYRFDGGQRSAQGMGGFGGGHKHQQKTDKSDPQKPKVDDKAYNAALKSLPDKPYDPWRDAR
jgi:hypothetical protein